MIYLTVLFTFFVSSCATSSILFSQNKPAPITTIPEKPLQDLSLCVTIPEASWEHWTTKNHEDSYDHLQRILHIWKKSDFAEQYAVYGTLNSHPFAWEIIPYQTCQTPIGRLIQLIQVLQRMAFGGISTPSENYKIYFNKHKTLFEKLPEYTPQLSSCEKGDDPFCKKETLEKQWVLTGKKVNALINYAPIGFGDGEKLHFLIVPKEHRPTFGEVTKEEYCESMSLAQKLITHFLQARTNIKHVYMIHKSGYDAAQTVPHWHLHVLFSQENTETFFEKCSFMKSFLWRSSPMSNREIERSVTQFRKELLSENQSPQS